MLRLIQKIVYAFVCPKTTIKDVVGPLKDGYSNLMTDCEQISIFSEKHL